MAAFDIDGLGPGQTRTYDLVLVPLANEQSGLGFWESRYLSSKTTCACPESLKSPPL